MYLILKINCKNVIYIQNAHLFFYRCSNFKLQMQENWNNYVRFNFLPFGSLFSLTVNIECYLAPWTIATQAFTSKNTAELCTVIAPHPTHVNTLRQPDKSARFCFLGKAVQKLWHIIIYSVFLSNFKRQYDPMVSHVFALKDITLNDPFSHTWYKILQCNCEHLLNANQLHSITAMHDTSWYTKYRWLMVVLSTQRFNYMFLFLCIVFMRILFRFWFWEMYSFKNNISI